MSVYPTLFITVSQNRPPPKMLLDSASKLAEFDAISLSSMSISSFGDDDDESVIDEDETCLLSPTSAAVPSDLGCVC